MSAEELRSASVEEVSSEVNRDESGATIQDLRSRLQFLVEDNLALRQELNRVKRSRAEGQNTEEDEKEQTIPKTLDTGPSRIAQAQDEGFRKLFDKNDATGMEYMPSMGSCRVDPYQRQTATTVPQPGKARELYSQRETSSALMLTSLVQQLLDSKKDMEERLSRLEVNEQSGGLQNRVAVCEKKVDSLIGRRDKFETKIREAVSVLSGQSQLKGRTFQAFILSKSRFDKKAVDIRLDQCEKVFFASVHFSQETCEYTIPESGLYEFRVRWRQSGTGQMRVTIHWGEEKVSRLGQTSSENDVLCPVIRRYVEEGVKVRLSAAVVSGAAKLETCDFGGSFITIKQVVEFPH